MSEERIDISNDEEILQDLLYKWQRLLGLSDWQIDVKIGRPADNLSAHCSWNLDSRYAEIVVAPRGFESPSAFTALCHGIEFSLVHELLHLHFHMFGAEGLEGTLLEQAINALTHAFLEKRCKVSVGKSFIEICPCNSKDPSAIFVKVGNGDEALDESFCAGDFISHSLGLLSDKKDDKDSRGYLYNMD